MANKFKESKINFLIDYIESGSTINLNEDEIEYLEVLTKMDSMRRRFGKSSTIKFFQKPPFNISAYRTKQMYDEAINLFYRSEKLDRKAMRALKAEQVEQAAELVMATATKPADLEVYGKLIKESYFYRQLDREDPPEIPENLYKKHIKIYTLDPTQIKLPAPNRNKVAEIIDNLEGVTEKEKVKFNREALTQDADFIEMIDEIKQENN